MKDYKIIYGRFTVLYAPIIHKMLQTTQIQVETPVNQLKFDKPLSYTEYYNFFIASSNSSTTSSTSGFIKELPSFRAFVKPQNPPKLIPKRLLPFYATGIDSSDEEETYNIAPSPLPQVDTDNDFKRSRRRPRSHCITEDPRPLKRVVYDETREKRNTSLDIDKLSLDLSVLSYADLDDESDNLCPPTPRGSDDSSSSFKVDDRDDLISNDCCDEENKKPQRLTPFLADTERNNSPTEIQVSFCEEVKEVKKSQMLTPTMNCMFRNREVSSLYI